MTAADLAGRALDITCSEAMGWVGTTQPADDFAPTPLTIWRRGAETNYSNSGGARAYSTDPATLDEKLAWLGERGVIAVWWDDGVLAAFRWHNAIPVARFDEFCGSVDAQGDTIHEATARLVVAVKESQKP